LPQINVFLPSFSISDLIYPENPIGILHRKTLHIPVGQLHFLYYFKRVSISLVKND